jgi:hypothetical protein
VSASFVVPAVVRPWRAAVARRALLVALFLGGFLVLAFLFGGHAHAAGPESTGNSAGSPAKTAGNAAGTGPQALGGARNSRAAGAELGDSVRKAVTGGPHAVSRDVRRSGAAVDTAVKPVVHAAGQVTRSVGEAVEPVTDLPRKLTAGLGARPGPGSADDSGRAAAPAPASVRTAKSGPRAVTCRLWPSATGSARPEPAHAVGLAGDGGADHGAPFDDPISPSVPASQQFTGANSSPRGADQHATFPSDRMGCALTAGAVSSATVAPVHQRPGDVLEFPA